MSWKVARWLVDFRYVMEKVRRNAVVYFLLQGAATAVWWAALIARPELRVYFQLDPGSETSLLAFLLPDGFLMAAGSLAVACLVYFRSRFEVASLWFVTGAVSYASAYTFSYVLTTDRGWPGVVMMGAATLWSGVFAMAITLGRSIFRQARSSSTGYLVLKTFTQIVVVWGLILFVFPYLITIIEDKAGIVPLTFPYQRPAATVLFLLLSSIGIYAAIVMSRNGSGTPLPLDHAASLVFLGPYAFLRNPMAVSGIGQGLAVALYFGSPLVAIYALMGSAIWQFVFRPLEEDDLAARFGSAYLEYCRNVKCWIPRSTAYRPVISEPVNAA